AQSKERGPVEFGIAADVVVGMRMEGLAVLVAPRFLRVIFRVYVYGARIPVVLFAPNVVAAFNEENFLARGCEVVSNSSAARPRTNDDHGVVPNASVSRRSKYRQRKMHGPPVGCCSLAHRICCAPTVRTYASAAANMPSTGAVK